MKPLGAILSDLTDPLSVVFSEGLADGLSPAVPGLA